MNIVITGAGKGIGYETLLKLLQESGHNLVAISRNTQHLREMNKQDLHCIDFDLEDFGRYDILATEIGRLIPYIDVLFNNAGYLDHMPFESTSEEAFDRQMAVNTKAPYFLIQHLLLYFSKGAHIVNVGSIGGFSGSKKFPGLSAYSISKGAVATLTECLAEELKDRQIHVNCLAFGAVQTEMLASAFPGYKAPLMASEMAEYTAWFCKNGHKFFNGKVLPVALSTP